MITNGMMLNINRNANSLNRYYAMLSTGKKISVPSDDPLLASRALKFRTNVAETEQYIKNVSQGISWMEVTEGAYRNVNNILFKIRELAARGSTDTLTYEDRQKIMTDVSSLVEQIGLEMNATYAGRYVFSGYRTDQPPVLAEDDANLSYEDITQKFSAADVQFTKVYERDLGALSGPADDPPTNSDSVVREVAVIKLAYTDLENPAGYTTVSLNDPAVADPYTPGNYIKETGEIVLAVRDPNADPPEPAFGTALDILQTATGFDAATGTATLQYDKTGFKRGELNPQIYFDCIDRTPGSPTNGDRFNPGGAFQDFEYEFSVNTRVSVNSNAGNSFTDKMYADYQSIAGIFDYMNMNTKEQITSTFRQLQPGLTAEQLEDAVAKEMQKIQDCAQRRFSDLLGFCDKHISVVGVEHTDVGSRMSRLELIQARLEDDRVNYMKLMSDNEDADYADAIMRINSLEAVYQASLKTGGSIMQLTLADYI
jgi:flagellar hook-associated protein 3 FlgL